MKCSEKSKETLSLERITPTTMETPNLIYLTFVSRSLFPKEGVSSLQERKGALSGEKLKGARSF